MTISVRFCCLRPRTAEKGQVERALHTGWTLGRWDGEAWSDLGMALISPTHWFPLPDAPLSPNFEALRRVWENATETERAVSRAEINEPPARF